MNYQFSKKRHQRVGGLPTGPRGGMVEDVDGQRTFNHLIPAFSLLGSLLSVVSGSPHLVSQHTGCGIRRIRCLRLAWATWFEVRPVSTKQKKTATKICLRDFPENYRNYFNRKILAFTNIG